MSDRDEIVKDLVTEAWGEGNERTPTALLRALEALPAPLAVMTSFDPPPELFDAFGNDAPGYTKLRAAPEALSQDERSDIVRSLRWVLRAVPVWTSQADPQGKSLSAIFVVLQLLGVSGALWDLLPAAGTANPELCDRLGQLLQGASISLSVSSGHRQAREQEIVDAVIEADAQENWPALEENWRHILNSLPSSLLFLQVVPYLAHQCPDQLRAATTTIPQMGIAWRVAQNLSVPVRLRLAKEAPSPRFRVAAVLSIAWEDLAQRQLAPAAAGELTEILVLVAQEPAQWTAWMKIFNQQPARYPWLQIPLGQALARISDEAVRTYVDAIHLYPWTFDSASKDRTSVGTCLKEFGASASDARRRFLWSLAYERWRAWDFVELPLKLVRGCCCSTLDYALVGYALENLTPAETQAVIQENLTQIAGLENEWHSSIVEMMDARNRLISCMQPFLAAQVSLQTGGDWLQTTQLWPSGHQESAYDRSRYS